MMAGTALMNEYLSLPAHRGTLKSQHQRAPHSNSSQENSSSNSSISKIDPSFKSKRYRDKLRCEIKALETLLPVDRSALHRKLDSQTVFRLVIAYFRTKMFIKAAGLASGVSPVPSIKQERRAETRMLTAEDNNNDRPPQEEEEEEEEGGGEDVTTLVKGQNLLQILDGFLLVLTADGTILYVSQNIVQSLGFNQVDLMHRCMYGIVHPDDHHELKMVLEHTLDDSRVQLNNQQRPCCRKQEGQIPLCKSVSFLIRIKCFNGTTTGYLKMHCTGHMRSLPSVVKSQRTSSQVLFALCRPFISMSTDPDSESRNAGFWSKHELDLRFRQMDKKIPDVLEYSVEELENRSFYTMVHPEDLSVFTTCHKSLIHTEEIQTMYFRVQCKSGNWVWLHTRGKVVFKNSKKYSIVFTHCPVREEDSTYIQQEIVLRRRYAIRDLMNKSFSNKPEYENSYCSMGIEGYYPTRHHQYARPYVQYGSSGKEECNANTLHSPHGQCPSSWHAQSECHSPVFPMSSMPYKAQGKERLYPDDEPERKRQCMDYGDYCQMQYASPPQNPSCMYDTYYEHADPMKGHAPMPMVPPQESTYRACSEPRPAPRQYLMHLNGVGVSPQLSPTTLVFQGQLTAMSIDPEPILPFSSQPWSSGPYPYANYAPQGPPSTSQTHWCQQNCENMPHPQYSAPPAAPDRYQASQHTSIPTCCDTPDSLVGKKYSPDTPPSCNRISAAPYEQQARHSTVSPPTGSDLPEIFRSHDPEVTRPSCIYQSAHYSQCKVMDVKRPMMTSSHDKSSSLSSSLSSSSSPSSSSCLQQMMTTEKKSRYELPAIGSFLEYLSTI